MARQGELGRPSCSYRGVQHTYVTIPSRTKSHILHILSAAYATCSIFFREGLGMKKPPLEGTMLNLLMYRDKGIDNTALMK